MRTLARSRLMLALLVVVLAVAAIGPLPAAAAGTLTLKGTVSFDDGLVTAPLGGEKVRLFVNLVNWQGMGYQSWIETATATTAGDGSYSITFAAPGAVLNARLVVIPSLCRNLGASASGDGGFVGSVPNAGAIAFSPALVPPAGVATYTGNDFVVGPPCRVKGAYGLYFTGAVLRGYPEDPGDPLGRMRVALYHYLPQLGAWLWDSDFWTREDGTFTLMPKYPSRDFKLRVEARTGLESTGATAPWPGLVTGWGQIEYRNYPNLVRFPNNNFYVLLDEQPQAACAVGVNVGGGVYTDTLGFRWEADQKYADGITTHGWLDGQVYTTAQSIANTVEDPLYQDERFNITGYRFWVPAATYTVTLKMAELYAYARPGNRKFDVKINGVVVDTALDPYTMAGAKYTAVDRSYVVTTAQPPLTIEWVQKVGRSTVTAIKLERHDCEP